MSVLTRLKLGISAPLLLNFEAPLSPVLGTNLFYEVIEGIPNVQSGRPRELPLLLVKVAQKRRASLKSLLKGGNVYLLVCHVPFIANGAGFLLQCTKCLRQAIFVQRRAHVLKILYTAEESCTE